MKNNMKLNVKILVLSGMLAAIAAALSWLESIIPIQAVVPIPGLKFGLANIVTMFAIFFLGTKPALAIVVTRCLLGAILGGGPISLAFSLTGALLAAITMILLKKGYGKQFSLYGISVGGSAAFNIGQVVIASIIMQDAAIFTYLPIMLLGGVVAGVLTAAISTVFFKKIKASGIVAKFIN
jgi:heptaprenyl diphosphate synthase